MLLLSYMKSLQFPSKGVSNNETLANTITDQDQKLQNTCKLKKQTKLMFHNFINLPVQQRQFSEKYELSTPIPLIG